MSSTRQAGADDVRLLEVAADPAAAADEIFVYGKEADGVTHLFARSDDGVVHQLTPLRDNVYAPPEVWWQDNVILNQVDVALATRVSAHFTTIKMIRAGAIVGLATRLTEAIIAGQLIVSVTLNGVNTACAITHTNAANVSGGVVTLPLDTETYDAGDLIGISINTDLLFLPITADLEAWIQLSERVV